MHLYELPMLFVLTGLALYGVLGGADFGAGLWQLTAGRGRAAERIREHAHESMGPVWEANHVWLIFVLTVLWTAYPGAFGSIASTLSVPLFIAGLGIIFRGAAYALRAGASGSGESRRIDAVFGVSSVLTPFALGAAIGGIASDRVPVGNAAGDMWSSWLGPTSILVGALAVATGAHLAAVFLAGDAVRVGDAELARRFRLRALASGVIAGAVAIGGLAVVHSDAHPLYEGLVHGDGLAAVAVSAAGGLTTIGLVGMRRFEPARYSAAVAVAAIVAGWALAQEPQVLPGLSLHAAAAGHDTLVAVVVAVLIGAVLLFPSLGLLFRLTLGGRLGHAHVETAAAPAAPARGLPAPRVALRMRIAFALLLAGIGMTNVADADPLHVAGALCLVGFVAVAFRPSLPAEL